MRASYEENPGQYHGEVEYEGQSGRFTLTLDNQLSAKVLLAIGDAAEDSSREALTRLKQDLQQSITEAQGVKQIEAGVV